MWRKGLVLLLPPLLFGAEKTQQDRFDPLRYGDLRGNLQLYTYTIGSEDPEKDAYATSLGGRIGYKSKKAYRFGVAAEYAGSHALGSAQNPEALYLFDNDTPSLHLNALSEGYLYYQNPSTYFRLGAQTLDTPLFNEDTTRIVPWSAAGASMTYANQDKSLTLLGAAISHIRSNTSSVYRKESASGPIEHGLYLLAGSYYPSAENALLAYLYYAPDLYDALYLQYEYRRPLSGDLLYCFGIQHIRTFTDGGGGSDAVTDDPIGGDDVNLIALKASADYRGIDVQLSYSRNFGQSGINNGYGGLSKLYTSSMVANGRKNNRPETWSLKADYELLQTPYGNTEVALWLTDTDYREPSGDDFFSTYAHLRHFFTIDTSLQIRYEHIDYDEAADVDYLRIIFKYVF